MQESLDQTWTLAEQALMAAADLGALKEAKTELFGKTGKVTELMRALGKVSPDEKKVLGQSINALKQKIEALFDQRTKELEHDLVLQKLNAGRIDVSLNELPAARGHIHLISRMIEDCCRIFLNLGFDVADGPEIETDTYNFGLLNFPPDHPARDMQDTFYLPDAHLLRTHTSPVQAHYMQAHTPPLAMVAPGVVYRCDYDQTHSPMFHQIEGLMVGPHIHFANLRAVVQEFLQRIFDQQLKFRFRPSFFPFTEPSAEVDMSCVFCGGQGCGVCKQTGWLEVMGCGMVHPQVLTNVGYDPQKLSGFAFGAGIERLAMLKYSINDLRLFFNNDIRFLEQF